MNNRLPFILALWAVCLVLACDALAAEKPERKIETFVSILPQAYFVKRVGGEYVDVKVLVGEGQSHETYEPTPSQMSQLARSELYFTIGVPFEKALTGKIRSLFPKLGIVRTDTGTKRRYFTPAEGVHDHGGHGPAKAGQVPDPHVWLDPSQVKIMAENICSGLAKADPAHAAVYARNLSAFRDDLDGLDVDIARILAPLKGRTIYVFHPAFGYFCDAYGLRQEALEVEGKEPGARQVARLIDSARRENVRVIFVQPQFSQKAARAVARSINGEVVTLNPLPRDYLAGLRETALTIRRSMAGTGG